MTLHILLREPLWIALDYISNQEGDQYRKKHPEIARNREITSFVQDSHQPAMLRLSLRL
jgi:hypothetical protein